jgi:inorganic pyrophosphatase
MTVTASAEVRMSTLARLDPHTKQGYRAVIETPQGSRHKIKFVQDDDFFEVARPLPAGMSFPFDFGFIPRTQAADGDPLDVLVLMDGPAFPGCVVEIRVLGVIEAEQTERSGETVRNDRLIAVAAASTERGDLRGLDDLAPQLLGEIESFFRVFNELHGKGFRPLHRRGPKRAVALIKLAERPGD